MIKKLNLIALLLVSTTLLANLEQTSEQLTVQLPYKMKQIAFVFPESIHGDTASRQQNLAREALQKQYGDLIKTTYVDNVSPKKAQEVLTRLADDGNDIIFVESPSYADAVANVAKNYPNTIFDQLTRESQLEASDKNNNNIVHSVLRSHEGSYLAGVLAASKTKTNVVAYTFDKPSQSRLKAINAFTLGAKSINKDIVVKIAQLDDPAKSQQLTMEFINANNVDIITGHNDKKRGNSRRGGIYQVSSEEANDKMTPLGRIYYNWQHRYKDIFASALTSKNDAQALLDTVKEENSSNELQAEGTKFAVTTYGVKEGFIDLKIYNSDGTAVADNSSIIELDKVDFSSLKLNAKAIAMSPKEDGDDLMGFWSGDNECLNFATGKMDDC